MIHRSSRLGHFSLGSQAYTILSHSHTLHLTIVTRCCIAYARSTTHMRALAGRCREGGWPVRKRRGQRLACVTAHRRTRPSRWLTGNSACAANRQALSHLLTSAVQHMPAAARPCVPADLVPVRLLAWHSHGVLHVLSAWRFEVCIVWRATCSPQHANSSAFSALLSLVAVYLYHLPFLADLGTFTVLFLWATYNGLHVVTNMQ